VGRRIFDDHYELADDRRFEVATADRHVRVTFDGGFPYAQVYAPPRAEFLCIEPMTARVNALVDGTAPTVAPGSTARAAWDVTVVTSR
jgi:galactose mutarotase-like enzyme